MNILQQKLQSKFRKVAEAKAVEMEDFEYKCLNLDFEGFIRFS